MDILKTPEEWFKEQRKKGLLTRVLGWKFDNSNKKITWKEYLEDYIHPQDR